MKYEQAKVKNPLTGVELKELLDYIDTLEAALLRADSALSSEAGPMERLAARGRIVEAFDKGK